MSSRSMNGRVAAFLGCTDEAQLTDAIELTKEGMKVVFVPGPSEFIVLGDEECEASSASPWYYASQMVLDLPDQISLHEPPPKEAGARGWWYSSGKEYLAWALAAFDRLDLLSVGPEISAQVRDPSWPLDIWLAWLETHGGGELITYDRPQVHANDVWLRLRADQQSGRFDSVSVGVRRASGPKDYDMGFNWLAAKPWSDNAEPVTGDLVEGASPRMLLSARCAFYADQPRDALPPGVAERQASGADVLAHRIWSGIDGYHVAGELLGFGDASHVDAAKRERSELHLRSGPEGCFFIGKEGADVGGAADEQAVFAFVVLAPGSESGLALDAVFNTDGVATAVRFATRISCLGSRWPWRTVGAVEIASGKCAVVSDGGYSGLSRTIEVSPGRYILETQAPAAWRLRLVTR